MRKRANGDLTDTHEQLARSTSEERDKEHAQLTPTRAAAESRMRLRANGSQTDTHEEFTRGPKEERDKEHAN